MALEFIGGTLFTLLYDGVKQAMSKSGTFKTLLGDLKSTLDSLEPRDIQQIGEHNVELDLPNEEIESLQMQMEDGVKLVGKLSNLRMWNYCCLDNYAQQIVELDGALKRLLLKLKMQEARDVKEVLVLSRQNRDKLDEVNRRLLDIRKLLQHRAGDVVEDFVSISNTETVPEQAQGNGSEQVTTFEGGAALQATFAVLWDVVMEVKDKTTVFKPLIENLMYTLDSLRPLMEEILEYRKLLDRQDECQNFRIQMEKGVQLVHKCSKVGMWTGCKSYKHSNKIIGLDESLQKLVGILKVQVARDVRETFISIRNIEAEIKRIEESGVLQNQTQADGWCALPEPSLPTIGSDVLNMQGTSDARETLVLSSTTKAGVEQIEGIGTEQSPSEITVDSPSSEVSSYPSSTTVVDSASSFGLSSFPASPLHVPPIPIFSMSSKLSRFGSVHLSLKQILKATHNFSRSQQVGEGNFGTEYKAWLDDGQVVSIKRAKKEHFENLQTEFSSEVELLAKIDHRNLVKLLGYVDEGNERLIITEYVPNGTLREHLDGQRGKILEFNQRLEIAIDVAHALTYLHTYAVDFTLRTGKKLLQESRDKSTFDNREEKNDFASMSVTKKVGIAASGMFLTCCVFLCPCFSKKRRESVHRVLAREPNSTDSVFSFEVSSSDPEKILASPHRVPPSPHRGPPSPYRVPPSPRFSMSSKPSRIGSVHLSLNQTAKVTRNFSQSQLLGEGGFGTVYKARLDDGQVVSIKRAKKEHFENLQTEFSSEVELLAKIDHRNLVKLLGYVDEGNERLIITEYVTNGTLREHLDGQHGKILEFNQRLEIAIDVAHALTYLHTYAEKQIIHRDVKSSNILLTESMRAKVADFGFAKLGPMDTDQTHISTKVKGTVGYLDPEYMKTYQLTTKSDVYSFGILLIEILTGRRPMELKRSVEERVTIRWAFKKLNEGRVAELVDPLMEETIDAEVLMKIFDLGIQCAAPIRVARPDMKAVGEQLWTIRADYLRSVKRGQ